MISRDRPRIWHKVFEYAYVIFYVHDLLYACAIIMLVLCILISMTKTLD